MVMTSPQKLPNLTQPNLRLVRPEEEEEVSETGVLTSRQESSAGLRELYGELAEVLGCELRTRAETDEAVRHLLRRFLAVGERLGVASTADGKSPTDAALADALVRQSLARRRVPWTTYRLQFNR